MKYADEDLRQAVASSTNYSEAFRKAGARPYGGSWRHLKKRCDALALDTSHFTGKKAMASSGGARREWRDVLVRLPDGSRRRASYIIRRAMLESGVPYLCSLCGVGEDWCGSQLNLDIDHVDGCSVNNEPGNLRFLCPNCHSQVTYS